MKSNKGLRPIWLALFLGAAVAGLASLDRGSALAAPEGEGPRDVHPTSHPQCELPASGVIDITPSLIQPGFGGTIPLPDVEAGAPDLVITCLNLDRENYVADMDFVATVLVQNFGSGDVQTYDVGLSVCRFVNEDLALTCGPSLPGGPTAGPVAAGEADLQVSVPQNWGGIVEDTGLTGQAVSGIPNAGSVFIRAYVTYFVAGVGYITSNVVLAQAVYPSAPENSDFANDADGDGWSLGDGDCNDGSPEVNPWHPEIIGNGIDDDCMGGDVPPSTDCPGGWEYPVDSLTCRPPEETSDSPVDRDADGSPDAATIADLPPISGPGDCNDMNSAIHPGAPELFDGADNNCNGLVDEGFGTPDWVIDSFEVTRQMAPQPLHPEWPWTWDTSTYQVGGLEYSVTIDDVGDPILGDLSVIQAVTIEVPFTGQVLAVGTEGFIPYSSFEDGPAYACDVRSLVAKIAGTGIYGETNFSNNVALADLGDLGGPDRDLRFASAPSFFGVSPDGFQLYTNAEDVGDCPPGPLGPNGGAFHLVRRRIFIEGEQVHDETIESLDYVLAMGLSDPLRHNDRVCVEVTLDPLDGLAETDEINNDYVQLLQFKNPLIGSDHFELIDAWSDGPGMTCAGGEDIGPAAVGQTTGALTGGGGGVGLWLGALGGALLLGGFGGGLGFALRRAMSLSGAGGTAAVAGAALVGVAAGAVAGVGVIERLSTSPILPTIEAPAVIEAAAPSCDLYLDPASASPGEGALFQGGDRLILDFAAVAAPQEPFSVRFFLQMASPSGETTLIGWEADPATGDPPPLDVVAATFGSGTDLLAETGMFQWSIDHGVVLIGGEQFGAFCQGSTPHTFSIGGPSTGEPPTPTDTPIPGVTPPTPTTTPTPSQTPTRTPLPPTKTLTPAPDITGPTIKAVSHSPSNMHESEPKGCTNTTVTVTAQITDPSGVASAQVLFFHTAIGAVPMTNTGGTNWQATLGPYADVGDGTVDYQVRATDSQGNTSDSALSAIPILACIP